MIGLDGRSAPNNQYDRHNLPVTAMRAFIRSLRARREFEPGGTMSTIERLPRGAVYCGGKLGSNQPDQLALTAANGPICSFLRLLAVAIWGITVLPQPPAAASTSAASLLALY